MTTSTSDRAELVWEQLGDVHCSQDKIAVIAAALRQAENEKLEEAARAAIGASRGTSRFVGMDGCQHFNQGVRAAEQAVLALKKD